MWQWLSTPPGRTYFPWASISCLPAGRLLATAVTTSPWMPTSASMMSLAVATGTAAERPNIVIIYGDDVGYGDLGAYGATLIPTPNLDRLAAMGTRFDRAYCAIPVCTPSRATIIT